LPVEENWHFALAPEVGVSFDFTSDILLKAKLKYNNAFESKDADALSYLALNIGVVWMR
jgi:hypothetical protein